MAAVNETASDVTPLRRIAHLDMDAFFASVELLRYPQLKGLPVVIGGARRQADDVLLRSADGLGQREPHFVPVAAFPLLRDYVGRGVITTATYEARQFGVGSAMGMMKAARLCPQAIVLPVDFDEVRRFSRLFKSTITDIAPVMQDRGVDEVYIDFTHVPGGQREGGRVLARLIQKSVFDATGLTCSIGVAPNRLLAKMASEFNKPHGISIVQALLTKGSSTAHAQLAATVAPGNHGLINLPPMLDPATTTGLAMINAEVTRQGALIGYINDFSIMMVMTLVAIPLLLLITSPRNTGKPVGDELEADMPH